MELIPTSLHVIDLHCKQVHARAYMIPTSIEQKLK
jgi:hypothetical protein